MIDSNPAQGVLRRRKSKGRNRWLTDSERQRLLAACRQALETRLEQALQAERAAEVAKVNETIKKHKVPALEATRAVEQATGCAGTVYAAAASEVRGLSAVSDDAGHAFHPQSWPSPFSARIQHRLSIARLWPSYC